jgi:hypothetical protein
MEADLNLVCCRCDVEAPRKLHYPRPSRKGPTSKEKSPWHGEFSAETRILLGDTLTDRFNDSVKTRQGRGLSLLWGMTRLTRCSMVSVNSKSQTAPGRGFAVTVNDATHQCNNCTASSTVLSTPFPLLVHSIAVILVIFAFLLLRSYLGPTPSEIRRAIDR